MTTNIGALREERGKLHEQMEAIVQRAKAEGRATLTDSERARFDSLASQIKAKGVEVRELAGDRDRFGLASELDRELRQSQGRIAAEPDTAAVNYGTQTAALRGWLLAGAGERLSREMQRACDEAQVDPAAKNMRMYLPTDAERRAIERRAQSVGTTTAGGFAVPDAPMGAIEQALKAFSGVRQAGATILRTDSGADLPIPQADDTGNKGAILAENVQDGEQDIAFTQLVLNSFKYTSKVIRVSIEFLQDNAIDADGWIGRVLGERIGRITNEHFTTGDDSTEPDGVLWSAGLGKTTASASAFTYDELVDLVHSVDPAYRSGPNVGFMFNDTTLATCRKLSDDQSRPLFQRDPTNAAPPTILGYPYVVNPDIPDQAAGDRFALFGDFSRYIVRDVREMMLMRLVERWADYAQVGFIVFSRHDGALNDAGQGPIKAMRSPAS